jgi:drug/metabolite transporter (DMT)-like permease
LPHVTTTSDEALRKGVTAIILSSFFYALVIILTKEGLDDGLEPSSFTFLTMFTALFFLVPYYLSGTHRRPCRRDYLHFFVLGLAATGIAHLLMFAGQSYTSAINAGFLSKTTTIFTVFFAFFIIRERLQRLDVAAIAVSFIGVFLLTTRGELAFHEGDALIVLSSVALGFSNSFAKKLMAHHSHRTVVFWRSVFGVPVLLAFSAGLSGDPFSAAGAYALANGFFMALTMMTLYAGFRWIGPSRSSTLFFISPLFSTVLAVALLGESLESVQIIGGCVILAGALLLTRRRAAPPLPG